MHGMPLARAVLLGTGSAQLGKKRIPGRHLENENEKWLETKMARHGKMVPCRHLEKKNGWIGLE